MHHTMGGIDGIRSAVAVPQWLIRQVELANMLREIIGWPGR
jgi:hypothetical protein